VDGTVPVPKKLPITEEKESTVGAIRDRGRRLYKMSAFRAYRKPTVRDNEERSSLSFRECPVTQISPKEKKSTYDKKKSYVISAFLLSN